MELWKRLNDEYKKLLDSEQYLSLYKLSMHRQKYKCQNSHCSSSIVHPQLILAS